MIGTGHHSQRGPNGSLLATQIQPHAPELLPGHGWRHQPCHDVLDVVGTVLGANASWAVAPLCTGGYSLLAYCSFGIGRTQRSSSSY